MTESEKTKLIAMSRAAEMKQAKVIPDAIGLYVLIKPVGEPLDGPFAGRIIGKDEGFYIVQRFNQGIPDGPREPGIWPGEIRLFRPGDLYGSGVTLYQTPELLDAATDQYWSAGRAAIEAERTPCKHCGQTMREEPRPGGLPATA